MAEAAQKVGAVILHFSSDYVFDGSGKRAWSEGDNARPLSVYGRSKLEGDRLVAANCESHLIFRTSWLYSACAASFAARVLRQACAGSDVAVVNDQIGAPTGADWVADMAALALRSVAQNRDISLFGVYHLAAGGYTSWHGYARFLVECAELAGRAPKTGSEFIRAVSSEEYPSVAPRPHNSRLDTTKFCAAFEQVCPPWRDGIARLVKEFK